MNTCDHGHQTTEEVRVLPLGRSPHHGNLILCRRHYQREMTYRRERARETGADKWEFPEWDTLDVYGGAP